MMFRCLTLGPVEHFPGLAPFDTLRTYAASGGHITTTWFATGAPFSEVSAWYEQRLSGYERKAPGDWTSVEVRDGVRHFHGVTVHAPGTPAPGPRPSKPAPPHAGTVVRDDTGAFPEASARPVPPALPALPPAPASWWQRIRARPITPR